MLRIAVPDLFPTHIFPPLPRSSLAFSNRKASTLQHRLVVSDTENV